MKTIEINDKHYTECDVVMLPTDKYSSIVRSTSKYGGLFKSEYYSPMKNMGDSYQHLYILSNEEIKEGDFWFDGTQIRNNYSLHKIDGFDRKIIATTDSSLTKEMYCVSSGKYQEPLPQIPQQFIEYYISEYNKDNVISKVLVEVNPYKYSATMPENFMDYIEPGKGLPIIKGTEKVIEWKLKLNQNNEISILIEKCEYMKEVGCIKDICICNTGPKQETLEEAAKIHLNSGKIPNDYQSFIQGSKWQAERSYSKEEVRLMLSESFKASQEGYNITADEIIQQFKKK